jgi:hypothetical protein
MFDNFVNSIKEGGENITYSQACQDSRWMKAMISKYQSIIKNDTWEFVPLPPGLRPISTRWVFKLKPGLDGKDALYKAHIVAHGNEQIHGVNFQETFAPMV